MGRAVGGVEKLRDYRKEKKGASVLLVFGEFYTCDLWQLDSVVIAMRRGRDGHHPELGKIAQRSVFLTQRIVDIGGSKWQHMPVNLGR